ncbi:MULTISPECIES: hypothetical protein [unclassified Kitasatospora]|uniref:hypothetical protein n=1 Tax=unclassified Kitasatospora TaxID=2633591 RepID=UPI00070D4515|nr:MULTISPECIES: hypothetical protein [unclassified Kitasatospora]KQV14556.1 hypothetical protein ASC99_30820 [Kitasatospora sp. Root107]KRB68095.1 hypothetical protein ASE03_29540 [Kitasatospora sp. Root187]
MLDVLLEVLAIVLVPGGGGGKRKARKLSRAFEAGETVTFEGCVVGSPPYCRPVPGYLTASRTTLASSPTEAPGLNGRPIPLPQVELVRVRDREGTDPAVVRRWSKVAECRDGEDTVLFACAPEYLPLLTAALGSVRGVPTPSAGRKTL